MANVDNELLTFLFGAVMFVPAIVVSIKNGWVEANMYTIEVGMASQLLIVKSIVLSHIGRWDLNCTCTMGWAST